MSPDYTAFKKAHNFVIDFLTLLGKTPLNMTESSCVINMAIMRVYVHKFLVIHIYQLFTLEE
jgi:hypothetical protein